MVRKSGAFDLNRCTVRQLVQLSGIPLDNARKLVRFRGRQQRKACHMEKERKARLERRRSLRAELQEEEGKVVRAHRQPVGAVKGPILGPDRRKHTDDCLSMLTAQAESPKEIFVPRQDQVEVHLPIPGPSHLAGLELQPESLHLQGLGENGRRTSRGSQEHSRDSSRRKSGPQDIHHVIVVEIRTPTDTVSLENSNGPMIKKLQLQYNIQLKSPFQQPQDLLPQQQLETSMDTPSPPDPASPDQVPLARPPPLELWGPPGAFPPESSSLQFQPYPHSNPQPTTPAAGPCRAALETEKALWFQDARCKVCGALERCWTKLQHSLFKLNPKHTTSLETSAPTVLQRNQMILEESRRCSRWRRRRREVRERERRRKSRIREARKRETQERERAVHDGRSRSECLGQAHCMIS